MWGVCLMGEPRRNLLLVGSAMLLGLALGSTHLFAAECLPGGGVGSNPAAMTTTSPRTRPAARTPVSPPASQTPPSVRKPAPKSSSPASQAMKTPQPVIEGAEIEMVRSRSRLLLLGLKFAHIAHAGVGVLPASATRVA